MALPRLSTIQTWAVFSVITLLCSVAHTEGSVFDEALKSSLGGCSGQQTAFNQAVQDIGLICDSLNLNAQTLQKCYKENLEPCTDKKTTTKKHLLASDDPDLGDTGTADCEEIRRFNEQCPGAVSVTPEDAARNRKEIRGLRDDLRKERQEGRKNDAEKLKQNQDEANKIMDEASKNDQDWAKQRKELNDKLRENLKQIDADSMKMIKDMQSQLDQIDMEYIKYRDALRRKISVANDTELAWNTQCRAAANEVASQAEAELNKRMETEALIPRNFRANSLAGKMRRDLKIKRQRIVNKYNETLAKCLRGDAEPGASMKLKLSQVKNDVRDSTAEANDKAARLEKLRQQIATNVNSMAKTLSDERQQAIQSNQQDLTLLDQAHNANQQRLQQRQQQMYQNQWRDSLEQMQAQRELNDRLNDMMGEEAFASAEYKCYDKLSKEDAAEMRSKRAGALKGLFLLQTFCVKKSDGTWGLKSSATCTIDGNPKICAILNGTDQEENKPDSGDPSKGDRSGSERATPINSPVPAAPKSKGTNGSSGRTGASQ